MRGELVLVRKYGGRAGVGIVWDVLEGTVLIYGESLYLLAVDGKSHLHPVGFSLEDVFTYYSEIGEEARVSGDYVPDWSLLPLWQKSLD